MTKSFSSFLLAVLVFIQFKIDDCRVEGRGVVVFLLNSYLFDHKNEADSI